MGNIEKQNAKFALFRNYDQATKELANIKVMASQVIKDTEAKKAELKAEITKGLETVRVLIYTNRSLIAEAPKGKEGKVALEAIQNEVNVVEASLGEVTALLERGELLPAKDKVQAANDKANALKAELEEVISKYSKSSKRK